MHLKRASVEDRLKNRQHLTGLIHSFYLFRFAGDQENRRDSIVLLTMHEGLQHFLRISIDPSFF